MATNRVLQLLRSSSTYASFAAAKTALEGLTTNRKDGEIVLARYTVGEGASAVSDTAIGVYWKGTGEGAVSKCTVFQPTSELAADLLALQQELDATQTGAGLGNDGSYTAPASGEAGYELLGGAGAPASLRAAIMALADDIAAMDHSKNYTAADTSGAEPVPAHATDASKVISGVNQVNGVLDTVTTDAVDLLLTGYANDGSAVGAIAATDTIEGALNKLENATSTGVQVSALTGNQITRVTGDATAANNGLFSHVEIAQLTSAEVTALSDANVREAYKLINPSDRTAIGDVIKIYKDSALQSVYIGHVDDTLSGEDSTTHESASSTVVAGSGSEALCFIYQLANGNYKLVAVDVESFLQESEFGDGLSVTNHVVNVDAGNGLEINSTSNAVDVKKDSSSEQVYTAASTAADVLTVGANGVKVANVQAAINYATDQLLSTTVTATNERGVNGAQTTTPHISITESTDSTTGLHSYAITETDIASEDELDAEVTRAQNAETAIDSAVGLTKAANSETRSYTSQVTLHTGDTAPTTVAGDIDLLDEHVEELAGSAVLSVTGSDAIEVDNTDTQNPEISLILDNSTQGDGTELTGTDNALTVTSDGLFLSNIWDCGTY